jgi:penicillin amidase
MKNIAFFGSLLITVGLIFALNSKIGDLPAFGKLLNPATGFYQNAETDAFYLPENIKNALLKEKVEVFFDDKRIPHIFAENEHDLYFTQGYIVASLRLWQMEFQVLAADGRLSEILGEKTLEFDKNQRRLGLGFGAQNKLKALETDSLALDILNAYTAGINAFIEQIPEKKLPLEYKLIGYKPEKWTNYKTMLVLMNMSNILASAGDDVENANFVAKYGKALFDQIYPTNINMEPVIPTPENGWLGKNTNTDTLKIIEKNNPKDIKISKVKDKLNYHIGSNNWAVSGTKTKSKYPLLSNDPHLSLSLPSVWIEMHLVGPNSNAYGVTFPGSPGIVIGFNKKIGWGMTNSGRDVKDYYTVEYKDASKNEYKYQNEWKKTTKKIEEYFVLGKKTVYDTVNYTVLGPVLHPDFETQNGKKDIAIQWMAHRESKEYLMFYYLNRAENFEDYLNATKYFDCPAQNMVFACIDGDIALRNQGKFPINAFEESKFLQNTNQAKVWQNFIPFDDNPMQHNPSRGFVSSANQESTDASYPYYYTGGFENYRNRVINQKLSAMQNATAQDMIALQKNNYNLKAAESLPLMLAYLNKVEGFNFEQQDILKTLSNWDFYNNADSKGAIYYELFLKNIMLYSGTS